ncbi:ZNF362_384 [Mytilus coruscus]|uniref:ZNF362_384 n=1 Tax=Mytilus coruscus TaxID=42192 RepID=A0A6J8DR28_MYTCO|nr:ZNF362_384 [Mytilus coruscus]
MDPWFENFKLMLTYWLMSNRDPTMAEAALTSRMAQPYLQSAGMDMQPSTTSNQNITAGNFPIPTSVHHRPPTPSQYHRQDSDLQRQHITSSDLIPNGTAHHDLQVQPESTTQLDRNHLCPTCSKGFKSKQQLAQHSLVHTNIRKYVCSYCDKAFKQLCHLQQHVRIHTGEKPYRCSFEGCDRAFAQMANLHHHMRNHDEHLKKSQTKQFQCMICHRAYTNESSLKSHMLKMHVHLKAIDGVQSDLINRIHKPKPTRLPSNGMSGTIDLTSEERDVNSGDRMDDRRADNFRFTNSPPLDRALHQRNDEVARFAHLAVAKRFDQTKTNEFRFNNKGAEGMEIDNRGDNYRFSDKRLDERDLHRADNFRQSADRLDTQRADFRFPDKNANDRLQDQQPENYRLSEENLIVRAMMSRDQQNLVSSNTSSLSPADTQIRGQEVNNRSNVNLADNSRNRNGRLSFPPMMPFDSPRVDFFQRPPLGSQSPRANSFINDIQQFNKLNGHGSLPSNHSSQRSTFDHMPQATNHISSSSSSFVSQQPM